MEITVVIIEDEERSRNVLKKMVAKHCPNLKILGEADDVDKGIEIINQYKPMLIFMDIQLKDGSGFDILKNLGKINSKIIFTTAFDNYAIKAFKFSALDYLLKPIEINELVNSVKRLEESELMQQTYQIDNLISNLEKPQNEPPLLIVSTIKNFEFLNINEIIRCKAAGAYSEVFMKDHSKYIVSKVIKEFEFLLKEHGFIRVHQSHLINLREVKRYIKGDNLIVMNDDSLISVSKSRKEGFLKGIRERSI